MTFTMMRHHTPGLIDCYAPVCGLLPKYPDGNSLPAGGVDFEHAQVVLIVGMQDALIPIDGGKAGRRGEVQSLTGTCEALEAMLGVQLGPPTRLESERTYTGEQRSSLDGRLRVITVQETGHAWPGGKGLGAWLPGVGKMATFSAGDEILRTFLAP